MNMAGYNEYEEVFRESPSRPKRHEDPRSPSPPPMSSNSSKKAKTSSSKRPRTPPAVPPPSSQQLSPPTDPRLRHRNGPRTPSPSRARGHSGPRTPPPSSRSRSRSPSRRSSARKLPMRQVMPKTLFDHRKEFLHIRYVSIYNFMADEGHVPPGGTSDASNPDWNAQIAQEEQLRRQEAAIKAAEDYPSASVGSVADKGADSITRGHIRCLQSRLERPDCSRRATSSPRGCY